jgi:hypothetical protein
MPSRVAFSSFKPDNEGMPRDQDGDILTNGAARILALVLIPFLIALGRTADRFLGDSIGKIVDDIVSVTLFLCIFVVIFGRPSSD